MPLIAADETMLLALVPSLEPNVSAPQGWALCCRSLRVLNCIPSSCQPAHHTTHGMAWILLHPHPALQLAVPCRLETPVAMLPLQGRLPGVAETSPDEPANDIRMSVIWTAHRPCGSQSIAALSPQTFWVSSHCRHLLLGSQWVPKPA